MEVDDASVLGEERVMRILLLGFRAPYARLNPWVPSGGAPWRRPERDEADGGRTSSSAAAAAAWLWTAAPLR